MGRAPCCDKANVKRGPWSPEEDSTLKAYIDEHGTGGNWIALPHKIGLKRCGKSCRLRWLNYLRPNIKHGGFSEEEDNIICNLYISIGSRWSIIAAQLPGRTDNDIKNYWNTRLKKKLLGRRKHSGANRGNHDLQDAADDRHQAMSSAALERIQLHMQLQSLQNPFTFYNNHALWPQLHPYQENLIHTVQSMNGQISSSPDDLMMHQLSNVSQTAAGEEQYEKLCVNPNGMSSSFISATSVVDSTATTVIPSFPANYQLDATNNSVGLAPRQQDELDCFKEMNVDDIMRWANDLDNKSVSLNSWDSTSVLQSHGMFQDYELGYNYL